MKLFNNLKIFIFIMIIFLNINVFATNTNVSSKVKYSTSSATGTYNGEENYLGGYNGQFTIGTRYNGRLSMVSFYISTSDYNFTTNHTYTITLNMATEDWRNNFMGPQAINAQSNGSLGTSLSVSNFRFVSKKQIKFNFKTSGTLSPYIFFRLYSSDYASTNSISITGVNNWNLSSIYINDNVSPTPTPAPVTPAPTATPQPSNQDIIDSANQNTQDIINNSNQNTTEIIDSANQNTTDIIENNNQNTQDIIDSNNTNTQNIIDNQNCPVGPHAFGGDDWININGVYLDSNGSQVSSSNSYLSPFINIKPNTTYEFSSNFAFNGPSLCFYSGRSIYSLVSCIGYSGRSSFNFTAPSNATYMLLSFTGGRTIINIKGPVCNDWEKEALDKLNNSMNNVNDTIKDSGIDDKTGFFSNFDNNNHGLTSIITLPLTTIQGLANTSCVSLNVPIPYTNSNVSLPCMSQVYQNYIPNVYSIWQVVSFGIISYFICLDIFKLVKGFKDPNEDKVEVLDL